MRSTSGQHCVVSLNTDWYLSTVSRHHTKLTSRENPSNVLCHLNGLELELYFSKKRYAAHLAAQFENAKSAGGIVNPKECHVLKCEMIFSL